MARIELEGDETDETNLPQKVTKAKPKKPLVVPPQKKQVVPNAPKNFVIKKPMAPAEQPEEMLTAEEWAERLKAEEEAKQQEAYPEEETEEQEEDEENKLMTKEEFLAYMQKKSMKEKENATLTTQKPAYTKRRLSIMDRLSANIDEALGVVPTPTVATTKPITQKIVTYNEALQQNIGDSQEIDSSLQEIPKGASDWMGLKSDPVLAGVVTLFGLILVLAGTFMSHDVLAALILEIIGLLIFVFGMVFVFGHVRRMVH